MCFLHLYSSFVLGFSKTHLIPSAVRNCREDSGNCKQLQQHSQEISEMDFRRLFYTLILALLCAAAVTPWVTESAEAAQSQETIPPITKEEFNSDFVGGLYAQMYEGQYTLFTRLFTQKRSLEGLPITWSLKWQGGVRTNDWPTAVCDEGICTSTLDFEYTSFQSGHGWIYQFTSGQEPEWVELVIEYDGLSYTERLEKAEIRPVSDWIVFSEDGRSAKLMHNPAYQWPFVRMTRTDWSWYNTSFSYFGGNGSFPIRSEPLSMEGVGFFDLFYYPEATVPMPEFELVPQDEVGEWRQTFPVRFQRYQWKIQVEHEGGWDFVIGEGEITTFPITLTNTSVMPAFYEARLEPSAPDCWEGWGIPNATLESDQHQHIFLPLDTSCITAGNYSFTWIISETAPPNHPHYTPSGEVRISMTVTVLKAHEEKYLLYLPATSAN